MLVNLIKKTKESNDGSSYVDN